MLQNVLQLLQACLIIYISRYDLELMIDIYMAKTVTCELLLYGHIAKLGRKGGNTRTVDHTRLM